MAGFTRAELRALDQPRLNRTGRVDECLNERDRNNMQGRKPCRDKGAWSGLRKERTEVGETD